MSRVFVTSWFGRYARKHRIENLALLEAVDQADAGSITANLGGCLIKLRIARKGEGKSGVYRTIIAYKSGEKSFYLYAFAKNERENISGVEQAALQKIGNALLALDEQGLVQAVGDGRLLEIKRE